MKFNFSRLLSLLLCLCLLCSLSALTVFAEGESLAAGSAADGNASGAVAPKSSGGSPWIIVVWIAVLGLAFYFLLWRPEKKRKKEADTLRNGIKLGDKITTIGGFVGEVIRIDENTITIFCGNTKMELQKWAVRSIDEISEESVDEVEDDSDDAE